MRKRSIVIGARRSALAVIQAREVGAALLAEMPELELSYVLSDARGDHDRSQNVDGIVMRGGFTEDLGRQIDHAEIDLAVHSWKDLPLFERPETRVLGTLQRADPRDLLLIRKSALPGVRAGGLLRVLSSSERRRVNMHDFLRWALPLGELHSSFLPVRGNIETRVAKLLQGAGDALVIAKAAIDRMLADDDPRSGAARRTIECALRECVVIVVPLTSSPAAPGQGALAIEARADRKDLAAIIESICHRDSFDTVQRERDLARTWGGDDTPIGVSILRFPYGDVELLRGAAGAVPVESTKLKRRGGGLPRPAGGAAALWIGEDEGSHAVARIPLPARELAAPAASAWLVARAEALPGSIRTDPEQIVWTAGLETWRKLAARGVWIHGSDESFGETGAMTARHLYPAVRSWIKYTHTQGHRTVDAEFVPLYRLERRGPLREVNSCTHFFWRSASQCLAYLRSFPQLASAWHGCGPGNSLRILGAHLPAERLRAFLSAAQFREELAS